MNVLNPIHNNNTLPSVRKPKSPTVSKTVNRSSSIRSSMSDCSLYLYTKDDDHTLEQQQQQQPPPCVIASEQSETIPSNPSMLQEGETHEVWIPGRRTTIRRSFVSKGDLETRRRSLLKRVSTTSLPGKVATRKRNKSCSVADDEVMELRRKQWSKIEEGVSSDPESDASHLTCPNVAKQLSNIPMEVIMSEVKGEYVQIDNHRDVITSRLSFTKLSKFETALDNTRRPIEFLTSEPLPSPVGTELETDV